VDSPLCYGTNVHPAEDLPDILAMLEGPAAAVRERFAPGGTLGLGLWLVLPLIGILVARGYGG